MDDDRSIRGAPDRSRISMQEDYEVRYWTRKWSSREQLAVAVREVGTMAGTWLRNLASLPGSARSVHPFRGGRTSRGLGGPLQRKDWLHLLIYTAIAALSVAIIVNDFR
jgi:hypothetical protein